MFGAYNPFYSEEFMTLIQQIITHFGRRELAEKLDCTPENLAHWHKRGIPSAHAISIERLSLGDFKAVEIDRFNAQIRLNNKLPEKQITHAGTE